MSHNTWLYRIFRANHDKDFMIWDDRRYSYRWLRERITDWQGFLDSARVGQSAVVAVRGDYTPDTVAILFALLDRNAVVVPLSPSVAAQQDEFMDIAEVEVALTPVPGGPCGTEKFPRSPSNPLMRKLIAMEQPGLVLFSSGSTGKSKAVLHNFALLLEKFQRSRRSLVTLTFLMIDHIGGINTLFYVLSNAGTVVTCGERAPARVCEVIERHKVELLPTSPTFLNLLLMSEAYQQYDLSSLRLITYGTEPMAQSTLDRIHAILPQAKLQQTYGLSELGILRSRSEASDSLRVKVGGEGFDIKVRNGTLWIKAKSAMLGYLNHDSPFDDDGWFDTGDLVERQGDYVRFLGRKSEIINVGGQKVYPAEIENVLLQVPNVKDVTVSGEANPITGNMVVARINLREPEEAAQLKRRVREYCRERLESFKIPAKIVVVRTDQFTGRFKKRRWKNTDRGVEPLASAG